MDFKPNDRIMVYASTGGGKTTLVAYITLDVENLAVYDAKRELAWLPNSVVVSDLNELTFRRREVFQPPWGMETNVALFSEFCRRAYRAGKVLVWIDESAYVTGPNSLPEDLKVLIVGGRARGAGCVSLAQAPAGISNPILVRQAQHIFVGYATDEMLEVLKKHRGSSVMRASGIKQYSGDFLLWHNNAKVPVLYPAIDIKELGNGYKPQI